MELKPSLPGYNDREAWKCDTGWNCQKTRSNSMQLGNRKRANGKGGVILGVKC